MLTIMGFGVLWVKVSVNFDVKWTLKVKIKYRYNNTDSALMGKLQR